MSDILTQGWYWVKIADGEEWEVSWYDGGYFWVDAEPMVKGDMYRVGYLITPPDGVVDMTDVHVMD